MYSPYTPYMIDPASQHAPKPIILTPLPLPKEDIIRDRWPPPPLHSAMIASPTSSASSPPPSPLSSPPPPLALARHGLFSSSPSYIGNGEEIRREARPEPREMGEEEIDLHPRTTGGTSLSPRMRAPPPHLPRNTHAHATPLYMHPENKSQWEEQEGDGGKDNQKKTVPPAGEPYRVPRREQEEEGRNPMAKVDDEKDKTSSTAAWASYPVLSISFKDGAPTARCRPPKSFLARVSCSARASSGAGGSNSHRRSSRDGEKTSGMEGGQEGNSSRLGVAAAAGLRYFPLGTTARYQHEKQRQRMRAQEQQWKAEAAERRACTFHPRICVHSPSLPAATAAHPEKGSSTVLTKGTCATSSSTGTSSTLSVFQRLVQAGKERSARLALARFYREQQTKAVLEEEKEAQKKRKGKDTKQDTTEKEGGATREECEDEDEEKRTSTRTPPTSLPKEKGTATAPPLPSHRSSSSSSSLKTPEVSSHWFTPTINFSSAQQAAEKNRLCGDLPVEERLLYYGACREAKLQKARQEAEQRYRHDVSPHLKRHHISRQRSHSSPVHRGECEARRTSRRPPQTNAASPAPEEAKTSVEPRREGRSKQSSSSLSSTASAFDAFLRRQRVFLEKKRIAQVEKAHALASEHLRQCTFSPVVSPQSNRMDKQLQEKRELLARMTSSASSSSSSSSFSTKNNEEEEEGEENAVSHTVVTTSTSAYRTPKGVRIAEPKHHSSLAFGESRSGWKSTSARTEDTKGGLTPSGYSKTDHSSTTHAAYDASWPSIKGKREGSATSSIRIRVRRATSPDERNRTSPSSFMPKGKHVDPTRGDLISPIIRRTEATRLDHHVQGEEEEDLGRSHDIQKHQERIAAMRRPREWRRHEKEHTNALGLLPPPSPRRRSIVANEEREGHVARSLFTVASTPPPPPARRSISLMDSNAMLSSYLSNRTSSTAAPSSPFHRPERKRGGRSPPTMAPHSQDSMASSSSSVSSRRESSRRGLHTKERGYDAHTSFPVSPPPATRRARLVGGGGVVSTSRSHSRERDGRRAPHGTQPRSRTTWLYEDAMAKRRREAERIANAEAKEETTPYAVPSAPTFSSSLRPPPSWLARRPQYQALSSQSFLKRQALHDAIHEEELRRLKLLIYAYETGGGRTRPPRRKEPTRRDPISSPSSPFTTPPANTKTTALFTSERKRHDTRTDISRTTVPLPFSCPTREGSEATRNTSFTGVSPWNMEHTPLEKKWAHSTMETRWKTKTDEERHGFPSTSGRGKARTVEREGEKEWTFHPQLSPASVAVLERMKSREKNVVKRLTTVRKTIAPPSSSTAAKKNHRGEEDALSTETKRRETTDERKKATAREEGSGIPETVEKGKVEEEEHHHSHQEVQQEGTPGQGPLEEKPATMNTNAEGTKKTPKRAKKRAVTAEAINGFYQREMARLEQKAFRIKEEKQRAAMYEVLECTFRPQLTTLASNHVLHRKAFPLSPPQAGGRVQSTAATTTPSPEQGPPAVETSPPFSRTRFTATSPPAPRSALQCPGVAPFLERQALAKRMKEEREERWRRLGAGKPLNGAHHTILTPFHLETEQRGRTREGRGPCRSRPRYDSSLERRMGSSGATSYVFASASLGDFL